MPSNSATVIAVKNRS